MIDFKRYPHRVGEPYNEHGSLTARQVAMARNKPEREAKKLRQRMPLFADTITGGRDDSFDPQVEYNRRQAVSDARIRDRRQFECKMWLKARKRFFELDADTQARIIKRFNGNRFRPKTAVNFATVVDAESGDQARRLAAIEQSMSNRYVSHEQLALEV